MVRSKLVEIQENTIIIDPRYSLYMPNDRILVIRKEDSSYYAVIDIQQLKVLQSNLDRKTIIPTLIEILSWTPETQQNNNNGKKSKKSKKNGTKTVEPPSITMLKFIKPRQQIQQQQQTQNQQPPQQQQQIQQQQQQSQQIPPELAEKVKAMVEDIKQLIDKIPDKPQNQQQQQQQNQNQ